MVYLVTAECKERYNLNHVSGSAQNIFREVLNHIVDDHVIIIDDYRNLTNTLLYFNIDYRAVLNGQDLGNHPCVVYEEDPSRVIDLDTFLKLKVNKPESDIERLIDEAGKSISNERAGEEYHKELTSVSSK